MVKLKEPDGYQKNIMLLHNLDPNKWMVAYESRDTLEVVSRRSRQRMVLEK